MTTPSSVTAFITSPGLRSFRRTVASVGRHLALQQPTVHFFYQVEDPYSHLVLLALPTVLARYDIALAMHLVGPPSDAAAPDRERLTHWSCRDAEELRQSAVLPASTSGLFARPPVPAAVAAAQEAMAALLATQLPTAERLAIALAISHECWQGDLPALLQRTSASRGQTDAMLQSSDALRHRYGHYLGGTLYFESEWFWGVDRLHYLERRLFDMGRSRCTEFSRVCSFPALIQNPRPQRRSNIRPVLHFFCSLRSPYTYLAVDRCIALARYYDAELRLRFVLPMVMRGLPVPREKRLYILRDAKREAETLGLPFGRISDPLGAPTERGLAVLHHATLVGKGPEFLASFMRGVWGEGINAGNGTALKSLAARAGLGGGFVDAALEDDGWRTIAAENRDEMLAAGLWGVPSFRVNDGIARWGQDRLWLVERDLREACVSGL